MSEPSTVRLRVFKTAWFSKAAKKAGIEDAALCAAVRQAIRGQAVDLGGGVFKKRLHENRRRAILLARGGRHWFCEYLFAKQDRDNVDDDELAAFRQLAKSYERLTESEISQLIRNRSILEICDADET
jgi:hypothetical protein